MKRSFVCLWYTLLVSISSFALEEEMCEEKPEAVFFIGNLLDSPLFFREITEERSSNLEYKTTEKDIEEEVSIKEDANSLSIIPWQPPLSSSRKISHYNLQPIFRYLLDNKKISSADKSIIAKPAVLLQILKNIYENNRINSNRYSLKSDSEVPKTLKRKRPLQDYSKLLLNTSDIEEEDTLSEEEEEDLGILKNCKVLLINEKYNEFLGGEEYSDLSAENYCEFAEEEPKESSDRKQINDILEKFPYFCIEDELYFLPYSLIYTKAMAYDRAGNKISASKRRKLYSWRWKYLFF